MFPCAASEPSRTDAQSASWLVRRRREAPAALQLFCFPHAGGSGAELLGWNSLLPSVEVVGIQLPGRGMRHREPLATDLSQLITVLGEALAPALPTRFLFFGHSMGALIAFALTRWLRERGLAQPERLVVVGRPAPHLPLRTDAVEQLDDDALVQALSSYEGVNRELLDEPSVLETYLPIVRADLAMHRSYLHQEEAPLACRITAICGRADPLCTPDESRAWQRHGTAPFQTQQYAGGHFFFRREPERYVAKFFAGALGTRR